MSRNPESTDINEGLVEGLAEGRLNSKDVEEMTKIMGGVKDKIQDAELKGILDSRRAGELRTRLERNAADKGSVEKIDGEVDVIISFVRKLKGHKEIDRETNVQNEIEEFLSKSPSEQRRYEQGLDKYLPVLDDLYGKIKKLAPERVQEFRDLTKGKIEFVQKILKDREANKKTYQDLIDANPDLFSEESKKEWMKEFEDLSSDAEQKRYIAEFQKQVDAKKSVVNTFKAFPEPVRKRFEAGFAKARRAERIVILQDMERALDEEALDILNKDPDAKHFSENERASAMKTFRSQKIEDRTKMFGLLRGMLKYNAGMSKKYEGLDAKTKLEIQEKMGFSNYYELSFDDKTKAITKGAELTELNAKLKIAYAGKLQKAVDQKYMAQPTADKFMEEFEERDSSGRMEWLALFETAELAPRMQVTRDYHHAVQEKYGDNPAKQTQLLTEFHELGMTGRYKKLEAILGENLDASLKTKMKARSLHDPSAPSAEAGPYSGDFETESNATAAAEENADETAINQALDKAVSGEMMKGRRKRFTIAKELAERETVSEQKNANTFKATEKKSRLKSGFEVTLNEKLANQTEGEMIIDREGNAQKIQKVDVRRMNKAETGEIFSLQREVTRTRGEKAKNVDNIQFVNKETGQFQNAGNAKQQVDDLKETLQDEAVSRAEQLLASGGIKITPALLKALHQKAAKTNMEVELQQTG